MIWSTLNGTASREALPRPSSEAAPLLILRGTLRAARRARLPHAGIRLGA